MAFYLSPRIMYHRLRKAFHIYDKRSPFTQKLQESYELYQLTTQQYLGFGVLFQFFPGTNANNARKQLSNELEPAIKAMRKFFSKEPVFIASSRYGKIFNGFMKYFYLTQLQSYLNIGPVFTLLDDIAHGFRRIETQYNIRRPLIEIIIAFPILKDIFIYSNKEIVLQKSPLINILHSMLNPFRIIDDFLDFIHRLMLHTLNIEPNNSSHSSIPVMLIKSIPALLFGVIKIPVKIIKHVIDFLLNAAIVTIINPVFHLKNSIKEAYQYKDQKVMITTIKNLQEVKTLRQKAKEDDNTNNHIKTKGHKNETTYIGINKEKLYSSCDKQKIVAIRASSKKINSTASLLSIVNFFNTKEKTATNEAKSIEEAKNIISRYK